MVICMHSYVHVAIHIHTFLLIVLLNVKQDMWKWQLLLNKEQDCSNGYQIPCWFDSVWVVKIKLMNTSYVTQVVVESLGKRVRLKKRDVRIEKWELEKEAQQVQNLKLNLKYQERTRSSCLMNYSQLMLWPQIQGGHLRVPQRYWLMRLY